MIIITAMTAITAMITPMTFDEVFLSIVPDVLPVVVGEVVPITPGRLPVSCGIFVSGSIVPMPVSVAVAVDPSVPVLGITPESTGAAVVATTGRILTTRADAIIIAKKAALNIVFI